MANLFQRSFASGEIAPSLYARTDVAKYATALRTCRNALVQKGGGVVKRPGTEFIASVKHPADRPRLIKFVFSVDDSFVLEFGQAYIRFYRNGEQVESSPGVAYEVSTPYLADEVMDLRYVQSGDVITLVHHSHAPRELKRLSNTNWTLSTITFGPSIDAPANLLTSGGDTANAQAVDYLVTAVSASGEESNAQPAPTTNNYFPAKPFAPVVVGWDAVTGATSYNIYRAFNGSGAYGLIGVATVNGFIDWGDVTPDTTYQPTAFNDVFSSTDNYPSVVTYYQQRLVFANTVNEPTTVWMSQTGSFHNFNTHTGLGGLVAIQDDDAIKFTIASDEVDAIQHILNLGRLVIMTEGAEWVAEGGDNGVITPIAINLRVASYDGSAALRPIKTGARMIYLQALGNIVRELSSSLQFGFYAFQGEDITVYANHLFDGYQIVDWDWQQVPGYSLWAVRSDGVLLSLTYVPDQQVLAWQRHDTPGFIERVCSVPENGEHYVYWVVRRLINGSYVRYVERMTTSIQKPVFASPDDLTSDTGIVTPPPPPPPPPPSPSTLVPPTTASTTDVGLTTATANWVYGNSLAQTEVAYKKQSASDWTVAGTVGAGVQTYRFTGLDASTAYEWRARHVLGTVTSDYLGPSSATRFSTVSTTPTLAAPTLSPEINGTTFPTTVGYTDITILWLDPSASANQRVQIAGPTDLTPTDGEYIDVGLFAPNVSRAVFRVTLAGTYWLRMRFERTGYNDSDWSTPSETFVDVT